MKSNLLLFVSSRKSVHVLEMVVRKIFYARKN